VLEGDPAKEGFFTMRVRLPDGYKIPPHTHPKVEHVTVISGTFNFGMGDKFDQSAAEGFIKIWGLPVETAARKAPAGVGIKQVEPVSK
jgi:quercetin dioxygenase-like cupin family protein